MLDNNTGLPSREVLHAEREQIKAAIARDRQVIARMRAGTVRAEQQFADSFDRLADCQNLIRGCVKPTN